MKKILNEWRSYLNETDPKHPSKPNPRNPYDRAQPKLVQTLTTEEDKDRARLRWHIGRFVSHQASRDYEDGTNSTVEFVNSKEPTLRQELIFDIKVLAYLYSQRSNTSKYKPWSSGVTFFNDTVRTTNATGKIRNLLTRLGASYDNSIPSEADLERVFKYYSAPTNKVFWPEEQEAVEPPRSSRFASQMSFSAEELARRNYELWLKNNKRDK